MKKLLLLFAFLIPYIASAQVPSVSGTSKIKFIEGNETWMAAVQEILDLASAGAGTVTSVDVSGGSTGLTTSGGAITTTGTITLAGTLDADNGGTGFSSYTTGDLLYATSSSALDKLADIATGNALITGGVGVAPSYGKIGLTTHVSGTLAVANGGTNLTAVGGAGTVIGSNGSANAYFNPTITTTAAAVAYNLNGSNLELNLPNADASNRGTVSTSSQTFAGAKTFSALVTGSAGLTSTSAAGAAALFATGVTGGSWTTVTANSTLDETDNMTEVGTLSGAITITLPACNATRSGWEYDFLKTGSDIYGLTIDPNGSETFTDSASTKTIYSQGNGATCKCRWSGSVGTWFFSSH